MQTRASFNYKKITIATLAYWVGACLGVVLAPVAAHSSDAHATHKKEERAQPHGEALEDLKRGNERFVKGSLTRVPASLKGDAAEALRGQLAKGQKPKAIVLSCSDSRVPPELVFDQTLGEVFAIRVAGNIVGAAQVASIEYALEHLGTNLIVVMGHESCGAVKAAVTTAKGQSAGSVDLDSLVSSIQGNLDHRTAGHAEGRAVASHSHDDKKLRTPVMTNVDGVSANLSERSKIIKRYMTEGTVKIVKGIYSLETGKVDFWGTP